MVRFPSQLNMLVCFIVRVKVSYRAGAYVVEPIQND